MPAGPAGRCWAGAGVGAVVVRIVIILCGGLHGRREEKCNGYLSAFSSYFNVVNADLLYIYVVHADLHSLVKFAWCMQILESWCICASDPDLHSLVIFVRV